MHRRMLTEGGYDSEDCNTNDQNGYGNGNNGKNGFSNDKNGCGNGNNGKGGKGKDDGEDKGKGKDNGGGYGGYPHPDDDTYLITGSVSNPRTPMPVHRQCYIPAGKKVILDVMDEFKVRGAGARVLAGWRYWAVG